MTAGEDWLPPLVLLSDSGGTWDRYVEVLFSHFHRDFIASRPVFDGRPVGHKRYPMHRGKEAGFWHLISEGDVEEERLPDLRRCERICWPRPMIEAVRKGRVKCWRNTRNNEQRVVMAVEDFSYVVVLANRRKGPILWTGYYVEQDHRRRKLEKEFLAFGAAPND